MGVKTKNVVTKEMLIRTLSEVCNRDVSYIRTVYSVLENKIYELLSSADTNTDVSIKIFEGITLNSTFVPPKVKTNNITGKKIICSSRIKPKANITRNYCEKLNRTEKTV